MAYWILGIFIILIVLIANNSIYYPTSYRAFIPKQWDSEYKEYQRLCKEEIGKVVYARPVGENVKLEDMDSRYRKFYKLSENISAEIRTVTSPQLIFIFISGVRYYTNWTKQSLSMHDSPRQYIECKPFLFGEKSKKEYNMFNQEEFEIIYREESAIIKQVAFDNKKHIGKEYEGIIFNPNRKWEVDMESILRRVTNFKVRESK